MYFKGFNLKTFNDLVQRSCASEYLCGKWDQLFDDVIAERIFREYKIEENTPIAVRNVICGQEYILFKDENIVIFNG